MTFLDKVTFVVFHFFWLSIMIFSYDNLNFIYIYENDRI